MERDNDKPVSSVVKPAAADTKTPAADPKAAAAAAAAQETAEAHLKAAGLSAQAITPVADPHKARQPAPWETMPFTNKEEARAVMTKIQAEIFKLFDVDKDGYLTEKDYTVMDNKLSDGQGDAKRAGETFKKMCEVMQVKTEGKITPIEYIKFKLREMDTKQFKLHQLKHAASAFVQQLVGLQHKLDIHTHCPFDENGKHIDFEALEAEHQRVMAQSGGGGHGHSHGGKPCHGHGGHGGHNHSHGGGGDHGHSHSHGGHGHSHGGKPCHGHGGSSGGGGSHGHSHGDEDDHGHSHGDHGGHSHSHGGGGGAHGHSHAQQPVVEYLDTRTGETGRTGPGHAHSHGGGDGGHGHSHDGKPCHGHGGGSAAAAKK